MRVRITYCPHHNVPWGSCEDTFGQPERGRFLCGQCGATGNVLESTVGGYFFCWNCVHSGACRRPFWADQL